MKQYIHQFTKAAALGVVVVGIFYQQPAQAKYSAYAGVDVGQTLYKYKKGYGENIMANKPYMVNFFAGYRFSDRFGVEVGYEYQHIKRKTRARINGADLLPGNVVLNTTNNPPMDVNGNIWEDYNTRTRTEHPYIGITGEHKFFNAENTKLLGLIGFSISKLSARYELVDDARAGVPTQDEIDDSIATFRKRKVIPMLRFGVEHSFSERAGVRANVTWRGISALKAKSKENPSGMSELRMKNGYNFNVGFSYKFM